jgi:hypothetical protein
LAVGAWQLIDRSAALGFVVFLLGTVSGIAFLLDAGRSPSRFGAAVEAVLQWLILDWTADQVPPRP